MTTAVLTCPPTTPPSQVPDPDDGPSALLAIAHGSRDPRHSVALHALTEAVRAARPQLQVELAFLDLCGPDVPTALSRLSARGIGQITAVPLFLTSGYHVQHDVPAALDAARRALRRPPRVSIAEPLGPDPLLIEALGRRVREAGLWPGDPDTALVLASAGSSNPAARAQVEQLARSWARAGWGAVDCAYASASTPTTSDAVRSLRLRGWRNITVASYFLAPGLLPDRVRAQGRAAAAPSGTTVITEPLTSADHPPTAELIRLLTARHAAVEGWLRRSAPAA
jgi:sirohydrochlorin ferrochelatase